MHGLDQEEERKSQQCLARAYLQVPQGKAPDQYRPTIGILILTRMAFTRKTGENVWLAPVFLCFLAVVPDQYRPTIIKN